MRHDPSWILIAAAVFYGAGLAMHGVATNLALHVAAVTVWTMGEILESPAGSAIVAALAPADARGRYQGARAMMVGAGFLVAPKLGTWVWQRQGPGTLWGSCLVLGIVVALALAITGPALRRRMAR